MELEDKLEEIKTADDFAKFLLEFIKDLQLTNDKWENTSIESQRGNHI